MHRQLHSKLREPWNWHRDLSNANSWLLRSPGILSRRALRRFLPLRRQLLDQPSTSMRNPSHQLNAQLGAKDMPDRKPGALGGAFLRDMFVDHMSYSAKCMAIPEEMALFRSVRRHVINAKYASQYYPARPLPAPLTSRIAAFEAGCTDSSRLFRSSPDRSIDRGRRFKPAGVGPQSVASWQ